MEWIAGIVIVALIVWNCILQKQVSGLKDWQNRFIPSLDEELLPIRQALNLVEPWEILMTNLSIDEEKARIISNKGFSLEIIAETDLSTFIANCGLESVSEATKIHEMASKIVQKEEDK